MPDGETKTKRMTRPRTLEQEKKSKCLQTQLKKSGKMFTRKSGKQRPHQDKNVPMGHMQRHKTTQPKP